MSPTEYEVDRLRTENVQLHLENKWLRGEKVRLVQELVTLDDRVDQLIADIERKSALGAIE